MKKVLVAGFLCGLMWLWPAVCSADTGTDVYKAKCASCHGAAGDGAIATRMGSKALGSADVQRKSDAELAKITADGVGKMMPGYKKNLTEAEIKSVVDFMRTLKK